MSLELSNLLINSIMSYEDDESPLVLKQVRTKSSGIVHIDLKGVRTPLDSRLFECYQHSDNAWVYSLQSTMNMQQFFHMLAFPDRPAITVDDVRTQLNIVWLKTFISKFKNQVSPSLFHEICDSVLIDFSIIFIGKTASISLRFSKHSNYLNKNLHFEIEFDMSFNLISFNFIAGSYVDNYQEKLLDSFEASNKLSAFHFFIVYYAHESVHHQIDSLFDIAILNDTNIKDYENIIGMIKI